MKLSLIRPNFVHLRDRVISSKRHGIYLIAESFFTFFRRVNTAFAHREKLSSYRRKTGLR